MSRILAIMLVATGLGFLGVSGAQAQVGEAVAVKQTATASSGATTRTLEQGMQVVVGERIETNESGNAQLRFSDDTRIVVGPGSSLTIDKYILDTGSSASEFSIRALGGTFRFISGNSKKSAYLIDTPVATIGVRGTGFDFVQFRDLRFGVTLMDGEIELCRKRPVPSGSRCVLLNRVCGLTYLEPDQDFDFVRDVNRRDADWAAEFKYMGLDQRELAPEFRLPISNCGHLSNRSFRIRTDTRDQAGNEFPPAELPPPSVPEDDDGGNDDGGNDDVGNDNDDDFDPIP